MNSIIDFFQNFIRLLKLPFSAQKSSIFPTKASFERSLVLKIGNSHLVAAFFENERIIDKLRLEYKDHWEETFLKKIKEHTKIEAALIGSVNSKIEPIIKTILEEQKILYIGNVISSDLSIKMSVDHPEEVGADLIANTYAALKLYPDEDLIVVDIGTAVTFSVVKSSREFIGAVIMPGLEMGAYGLKHLTDKLPLVDIHKPMHCLGKNSIDCISSGLYYGLLGAIDKILLQLSLELFQEKEIRIIITGGVTTPSHESAGFIPKTTISKDLQKDLTMSHHRKIEPDLTLLGFFEILKEQLEKKRSTYI